MADRRLLPEEEQGEQGEQGSYVGGPHLKRPRLAEREAAAEETRKMMEHLAGRGPVRAPGTVGPILEKKGTRATRYRGGKLETDVIVLGGACSEALSGPRLAKVLRPALAYQMATVEALEKDEFAFPTSIHTSVGYPSELGGFLKALEPHLPWTLEPDRADWFVNLQLHGGDAVWAGVEALMHLQEVRQKNRSLVACADRSYHGPKTTSLGSPAIPRWPGGPVVQGQVCYEAPMSVQVDEDEYLKKFDEFLRVHGDQVGVIMFEPQWGSSAAGLPWPKNLLRECIKRSQAKGILVFCDEILCGLGRHGQGTIFLSKAWDLNPDAVSFGKSMGVGFPLAGCLIKNGARELGAKGRAMTQSHTYAASSAVALLTGKAVLEEVPRWFEHAKKMGAVIEEMLSPFCDENFLSLGGQGLLYGCRFMSQDPAHRLEATRMLREHCGAWKVWPYFMLDSRGGFLLCPPMDTSESELREGLERLGKSLQATQEGMKGFSSASSPARC